MQDKTSPLFSIIMPVYNTEIYLDEAIDSVISQSFENWELICVDDGSTDGSLEVLRNFEKKDYRIKVFTQKNAGTASAARNKALNYSTGQYIALLDSDDKYDHDILLEVQKRIEETNADYILFNTCFYNADLSEIKRELKGLHNDTSVMVSGRTAFLESLDWSIGGFGAVRQEIVKKIRYNETGMNGDELSTRLFFLNSKSVAFSEGKYLYRVSDYSTTRKFSVKRFYTLDTDLALLKIVSSNEWASQLLPSLEKKYFMKIFYFMVLYFRNMSKLSYDEKRDVRKYIANHYSESKNFLLKKQSFNSKLEMIAMKLASKHYLIFLFFTYLISWKK